MLFPLIGHYFKVIYNEAYLYWHLSLNKNIITNRIFDISRKLIVENNLRTQSLLHYFSIYYYSCPSLLFIFEICMVLAPCICFCWALRALCLKNSM